MVVGLFVLTLTAALIIGAFWLSTGRYGKVYVTYIVDMDESVSGVSVDSAVKYNGVKVGFVKKITLNLQNPKLARVYVRVEKNLPITEDTEATIKGQGFTGVNYIDLNTEKLGAPLLKKKPGEPYPIIKSGPSLFAEVGSALKQITVTVHNLGDRLGEVLDKENQESFRNILNNIEKVSGSLAVNSQHLNSIIPDLAQTLKQTAAASNKFSGLVDGMQDASQQVSATMVEGQVVMKQLSRHTLPHTVQLMQRLNTASAHLERLAMELERNPGILLRGKVAEPRGPGE